MNDCNCLKKTKFVKDAEPSCEQTAVIPILAVDTVDGIKGLSNCLVRVDSNNTVYYIDSQHRIIQTWAGIVTVSNYDYEGNPLNLRNQVAFDTETQVLYFFDVHGKYFTPSLGTISFNNLLNRPSYAGQVMTSETNIPDVTAAVSNEATARENADNDLQGQITQNADDITTEATAREAADNALSDRIDAVKNTADSAVQPIDLNFDVLTDLVMSPSSSTSIVQLDGSKLNPYTGATATTNIPLPVASSTQAGVINTAIYGSITDSANKVDALLNGAIAITGLSASPSQSDLTTAWEAGTGLSTLINRAAILDVDNDKIWTYYVNTDTWYQSGTTGQISINTFTNTSEGTIRGSTVAGQIFAENDGTGSVNGWDALVASVANNTAAISDKQDTLVSGTNIKTINGTSILGSGNISISSGSGTITSVQANGTTIATSGTANIPAATTSRYGVTQLSSSVSSTSTTLAATPSAVRTAYNLASTANTAAATAQTTAESAQTTADDALEIASGTVVYDHSGSATVSDETERTLGTFSLPPGKYFAIFKAHINTNAASSTSVGGSLIIRSGSTSGSDWCKGSAWLHNSDDVDIVGTGVITLTSTTTMYVRYKGESISGSDTCIFERVCGAAIRIA